MVGLGSGIKKVKDILGKKEVMIFDKISGREKIFRLEEDRVYIIPGYQREIQWSTENVQVLIDDLRKGSKFLGTITLSTSEERIFEVIDGQQRLTVLTLLITYLNKVVPAQKKYDQLCCIDNVSFKKFQEVLKYEFDYERIKAENRNLYEELELSDPLSQKDDFKRIWDGIAERVNSISKEDQIFLFTALLESDLNVIINEIEGTDTQRKFCVDYFIDINNKSVVLEGLDIIRAYAFREDFAAMSEKWIRIQDLCNELKGTIKYTREVLYYQYFICRVNKEIDYSISKLSEQYTIKENIYVNGKSYSSGTYVWNIFKNDSFYSNLLKDLNDYLEFIKIVKSSEDGREDDFKKYFKREDGKTVDETRIVNAHSIINAILRNDDLVPKMMVLKYFLEILKPEKVKENKYRIINHINMIANVFTMSGRRKGSEQIAGRLLQEDWERAIKDLANKMAVEIPQGIGFGKVAKSNNVYTVVSGQYMAKRYITMRDAYTLSSAGISVNEDIFKNANSTNAGNNVEHFIVNRNFGYTLYSEDGTTIDIEIQIPGKYKKCIATIANYLIINSQINSVLGNRPVYEKIEMLEDIIDDKGLDYAMSSKRSQLHYYLIKKIFHDESHYPAERLSKATNKRDKKKILRNYYTTYFESEFNLLISELNNDSYALAAKLEHDLMKIGFIKEKDMDMYIYNMVCMFANIEAEIDAPNGKLIMSAELFNPTYGEEEDKYSEIIEQTINAFTEILEEEPCIESSNEWEGSDDESFRFSYVFDLDLDCVKRFLDSLVQISGIIS